MKREEAIQRFNGITRSMSISVAQAKFYPTKAELNELCDMAIKALQAKTDGDLISRSDAICEVLVNDGIDNIVDRINALPSAKAVSKGVLEQFRWERDVAMAQLEEYGIPFGTDKDEDMVRVVRCKDCKHYSVKGRTTQFGFCGYRHAGTDETDYCSRAERRGDDEK